MSFKDAASLFPDTYGEVPTETLLVAYRAGASRMRAVIDGLEQRHLQARPIAGKWSIQEIVMHVTDSEIQAAFRFRQAFAAPGSASSFYDQDVWAREFDYNCDTPDAVEDAIDLLVLLRRTTDRLLVRLDEAGWRRTVVHPEMGLLTIRQLLELYADHTERHAEQILQRRSLLHQPLDLPSLLPTRLY